MFLHFVLVSRIESPMEDGQFISSISSGFSASLDKVILVLFENSLFLFHFYLNTITYSLVMKAKMLGLGSVKYSLTWSSNLIILQSPLESLLISMTLEETANLSQAETNLLLIKSILQPFSSFDLKEES